jgi:hypothetical protein
MEFDVKFSRSLLGESALQAFRSDLPERGARTDAEDEASILVATILRQQFAIPDRDPARKRLVSEAIDLARNSLGPGALDEGCSYDEHPARSDVDVVRRLVQRTEHKGWLRLSQHLLESLAGMATDAIDQGRVLYDRARNSRKQGQLELSLAQADELGRFARRIESDELLARFHSSNCAYSQIRGNFVEMRRSAEALLQLAKQKGFRRFEATANAALGIVEARTGRYGEGVAHLWSAYRIVDGKGVIAGESLGNLAQLLAISGRPVEGRKAASLYLSMTNRPQSRLPALGTYVLCSARLGDAEAVGWACDRVRAFAEGMTFPREVAEALLECAIALDIIGREEEAGVFRQRAEALATSFGFHDLTFAESLVAAHGQPSERPPFKGVGARAEQEIAELDVPRIPRLDLVGA